MLELELKDSLARHKTEVSEKLSRITQVRMFSFRIVVLEVIRANSYTPNPSRIHEGN